MSVQAMGRVWELDLPHAERLVLLALADHADHVGDNIYPSIGLIAWKTGYSSRQVQRVIKSLIAMEILCVVEQPEGRSTVYRMDLKAGTVKEPYLRQNVRGDKMSGVTKRHPEARQNVTPTPDIAMSPKPLSKPSGNPKAAASERPKSPPPDPIITGLIKAGLTPQQAERDAPLQEFTPATVAALLEWSKELRSRGVNPGKVLQGYTRLGMLPDDLPQPPQPPPRHVNFDENGHPDDPELLRQILAKSQPATAASVRVGRQMQ